MGALDNNTPTNSSFSALLRLLSWGCWLLLLPTSYGFLFPATLSTTRSPPLATSIPPSASTAPGVASGTEAEAGARTLSGTTGTETDDDSAVTVTRATAVVSAAPGSSEFQEFVERRKAGTRKVVLDLRPVEDFRRRHLEGSTSIPMAELEHRLLELPPPFAQPVSIVGSEADLRTARDLLTKKGWQINAEIGPDLIVPATDGEDPAPAWPTEAGSTSRQVWRANDFLEFCTQRYLLPSASALDIDSTDTGERLVLDLGCGNGRDAVYMAQNLPLGTRVVGVDNHSYALERGAGLAEQWLESASSREGRGGDGAGSIDGGSQEGVRPSRQAAENYLEGRGEETSDTGDDGKAERECPDMRGGACEWLLTDLRKEGSLTGLRASIVHGHRFKCEQLLPLLRDDVLLPGGYFIWSTFLDTGTENLVPPWRPSRMMRPGELASIFSGNDFEILIDEHGDLPTRGSAVPANFFACRKLPIV